MRKPDFFILGAPKCGTTSLAAWLADHPAIYMSPAKEPHYFNTDDKRVISDLRQYEALFEAARPEHQAIGEASVWYLSSADAVPNILQYNPESRFIVMLRNPLEMAPALHAEMLYTGVETERDFARAWRLQSERRHGREVPRLSWEPRRLQYGENCLLGTQLERLFGRVGSNRVLPVLLDDIRRDARGQYRRTLQFLGVPDDGRSEFAVHNSAKVRRWSSLPRVANAILEVKRKLGITRGFGLWTRIDAKNRVATRRELPPAEIRMMMCGYFAEDVARLGRLLQRDLREWLA